MARPDDDEPRWLTDDEQRAWMAIVAVMFTLPTALDSQLRRDAGLSHFEYAVLAALSAAPGRTMRMGELAKFSNSSLSRLSHVVKRMEDRKWITRSPLEGDRRVTVANLTGDGFAVLQAAASGHVAEARRLVIDCLSPEQLRQLSRIGERIVENLDPQEP